VAEDTVLRAEGVSAGYGKKVVVDGLAFEVRAGEILTIIGPNGAGKSTVLKSIAAQLPLISGRVSICGGDLSSMKESDISRRLSVCLTDRIDAEKMTCSDIVSTGRYPYTGRLGLLTDGDRAAVREAMELTGTAYLADTDFRCISDGQRQTVMLARAIAQQPQVMLLDEPTSFLDINNKLRLLTVLRELVRSRNIAVVQSLHEIDLAQRFSDKILCVHSGKADRLGTPEDIFSDGYISGLYSMTSGTFNGLFGTAEAERVTGRPEVFVIGGGGSGIPMYRMLQRRGTAFAAGVIHENDLDFPVAAALSAELITEKSFEPVSAESLRRAKELIDRCGSVICTVKSFGQMNLANKELAGYADSLGKLRGSI